MEQITKIYIHVWSLLATWCGETMMFQPEVGSGKFSEGPVTAKTIQKISRTDNDKAINSSDKFRNKF